ncbi:MAG: glycosyltransferase family 2 protein [Pedobacter sp.]|nr:MAG: glycosyltransferase family 2 protein [Pedobacter sp.]
MNPHFTFIILTFNEELHLPRILQSIAPVQAKTFIIDSGSTDHTLEIAAAYKAEVKYNKFINHPLQWDFALQNCPVKTPWIIGLDADQTLSPELLAKLQNFDPKQYENIDGIYFNRKNIFQGKWLKYGGYFPFYLLKMFRTSKGYSDLNENMDHRFIVEGNTTIWDQAYLIEENLKENDTQFWIEKHEKYAERVAHEEFERLQGLRNQTLQAIFFGNPDQRTAWLKRMWWKLPLGLRPYLYFSYRMFFKLGILDGKTGRKFHYLHALWFRKLIDKKLKELLKEQAQHNMQ